MKAAVVHTLGQPPQYRDFSDPALQEGEVLIHVRAAGMHPIVRSLALGQHYSFAGELPMVVGIDGVGTRPDGTRVYFAGLRSPWGSMAELAAAPASMTIPLPEALTDETAAAIANPGMSAWLSTRQRAALVAGESVLILGATGVAGQLAIQAARHLGARRIVAAGRNVEALAGQDLDVIIPLGAPEEEQRAALAEEVGKGIDVVIDYLWGRPTELVLEALARSHDSRAIRTTRLVEVGQSAGATITLPGAYLRAVDLRLLGSGFGSVPLGQILESIHEFFDLAAAGVFTVDVDPVPLTGVEQAWGRAEQGKRVVFRP